MAEAAAQTKFAAAWQGDKSLRVPRVIGELSSQLVVTMTRARGKTLVEATPDADDLITLDVPAQCTGWCDLYIVFNSTFEWWLGAEDNSVAKLLEFDWTPR